MTALPFVWPYALVFWAVFLWAFLPELALIGRSRQRAAQRGSRDAGSLRVILIGMWLAFAAAFPLASVRALRFSGRGVYIGFAVGLLCVICGSLLRRHCWRILGAYFTGDVAARQDQPVIDLGAYAWIRHPSYSGGILMNVGIGIALASWGSALLLAIVSFAVYAYRIAVEERALLETIGDPYRRYMQVRKRLLPYVY